MVSQSRSESRRNLQAVRAESGNDSGYPGALTTGAGLLALGGLGVAGAQYWRARRAKGGAAESVALAQGARLPSRGSEEGEADEGEQLGELRPSAVNPGEADVRRRRWGIPPEVKYTLEKGFPEGDHVEQNDVLRHIKVLETWAHTQLKKAIDKSTAADERSPQIPLLRFRVDEIRKTLPIQQNILVRSLWREYSLIKFLQAHARNTELRTPEESASLLRELDGDLQSSFKDCPFVIQKVQIYDGRKKVYINFLEVDWWSLTANPEKSPAIDVCFEVISKEFDRFVIVRDASSHANAANIDDRFHKAISNRAYDNLFSQTYEDIIMQNAVIPPAPSSEQENEVIFYYGFLLPHFNTPDAPATFEVRLQRFRDNEPQFVRLLHKIEHHGDVGMTPREIWYARSIATMQQYLENDSSGQLDAESVANLIVDRQSNPPLNLQSTIMYNFIGNTPERTKTVSFNGGEGVFTPKQKAPHSIKLAPALSASNGQDTPQASRYAADEGPRSI